MVYRLYSQIFPNSQNRNPESNVMAEERGSDGEDDFELGEEEYDDNGEHEVDLQKTTHPQ